MFLYEERIGQSSPTAIQGSIVWSVQHEAGADGKQEASVQGTLTVPERNLTAQINFKRNSDPSLPASHIVETLRRHRAKTAVAAEVSEEIVIEERDASRLGTQQAF